MDKLLEFLKLDIKHEKDVMKLIDFVKNDEFVK